jgi:hypothetical protein
VVMLLVRGGLLVVGEIDERIVKSHEWRPNSTSSRVASCFIFIVNPTGMYLLLSTRTTIFWLVRWIPQRPHMLVLKSLYNIAYVGST